MTKDSKALLTATIVLSCAGAAFSPSPATPPRKPAAGAATRRAATLERLRALGGAEPARFSLSPEDACFGLWNLALDSGDRFKLEFIRFENLPIVHIEGGQQMPDNVPVTRLAANSVKFTSGYVSVTMTCLPGETVVDASINYEAGWQHVSATATEDF